VFGEYFRFSERPRLERQTGQKFLAGGGISLSSLCVFCSKHFRIRMRTWSQLWARSASLRRSPKWSNYRTSARATLTCFAGWCRSKPVRTS